MINRRSIYIALFCAIECLLGAVPDIRADEIAAGANLPAEARARIDKLKPDMPFGSRGTPPSPDYSLAASWAALPDKRDPADFAPANTKYPESQDTAAADVFFIYPTTAVTDLNDWNIPIDDPVETADLDGILMASAGIFNAAARVYVPRYREAAFYSFFDDKTDSGMKAIELAYRDVERAFLYYVEKYNNNRPFMLAGHSQGAIHALRLLQEHIIATPLHERMIASYLIGGAVPLDIKGIRPSRSATDTGVVIGWNTYTRSGDPSVFMDCIPVWTGSSYVSMGGKPLLQTNPLSWRLNGPKVRSSRNPGSLPLPENRFKIPDLIPGVCGADASGKVLLVDKPPVKGFAMPDTFDTPVFNPRDGDYHIFDCRLFYESIRKNAVDRVKSFLNKKTR